MPTQPIHSHPMPDTGHVDPRIERTQAAILEAAEALLVEGGPDAITHANVADRAKVSRTTVYTHHPTREDLLRATLEPQRPALLIELTGDLRTDLVGGLIALAADLGDEHRMRVFVTVLERSHHDPVVASVRKQAIGQASMLFQAVLQRAIDDGDLRPDLDTELAMASLVGTFFFRRFLADQPVTPKIIERVVDTFLDANAPR